MKNIKKLILLSLLFVPLLTACGNKDILGMTYTFKYATVKLPDGTLIDGEVKEWARSSDTDSEGTCRLENSYWFASYHLEKIDDYDII